MLEEALTYYRAHRKTKAVRWCDDQADRLSSAARRAWIGPSIAGCALAGYFDYLQREPHHRERLAAVFFAVLREMYGGESLWQNKRPKRAKLEVAKTMTATEMQRRLGISRSYAHQLRKEALTALSLDARARSRKK